MLKNILAITGKPGLFRLVSRGNNMLIIESLEDGKRMPTYARDKIVSLADISMYTEDDDMALHLILDRLKERYDLKPIDVEIKKLDNDTLRSMFAEVVENFDRERVYPSDIRKLFSWYNILIKCGVTDFSVEEESVEPVVAPEAEKKTEKKAAPKTQVKTQKSSAKSVKTGVGAKKG